MRVRHIDKGAILSLTIIFATIFIGLLFGILFKSAQLSNRFNAQSQAEMQARYAAYGAIERAYGQLAADPEWRDGFPKTSMPQCPTIFYRLKVADTVPFAELGADELGFIAQGYSDEGEPGKVLAALGGTVYKPPGGFEEAVFADAELILTNTDTHAMDSRQEEPPPEGKASVGSNRNITVNGGTIDGDLIVCDPSNNMVNFNGTLTGETVQEAEIRPLPGFQSTLSKGNQIFSESNFEELALNVEFTALDFDEDGTTGLLHPGAYKTLTIENRTLKLSGGEYYFQNAVNLENVTLIVEADTKLIVGKSMTVLDSQLNVDGDPSLFSLLFSDEYYETAGEAGTSYLRAERTELNGVVAGQGLTTTFQEVVLKGALQALSATAVDSELHFDKAVEELDLKDYKTWRLRQIVVLPANTPF